MKSCPKAYWAVCWPSRLARLLSQVFLHVAAACPLHACPSAGLPGCPQGSSGGPQQQQGPIPPGSLPPAPALLRASPGDLKAVRQQVSRVLWQCSSQFCAWCGEWCVLLAAAGGWQLLLTAAGWLHSLLLLMAGCLQVGPHDKSVAELLRAAEALAGQSQGRLDTAAILSGKQAPSGAPLLADWVGPIEDFPSPIAGAPCCRRACLLPLQAEAKDRRHAPGNLWNALTCPPPPAPARPPGCLLFPGLALQGVGCALRRL